MLQELTVCTDKRISTEESETGNLLLAVFLLDLFFNPENGGDKLLRSEDDFQRATRCYASEDRTLLLYRSCIWVCSAS
jgi:hypothetical protein